jgi:hypothetical protein
MIISARVVVTSEGVLKMIAKIKQWFKDADEKDLARLKRSGYNYAAGRLLKEGNAAITPLCYESDNPFDGNEFDIGIVEALLDFERRGKK